MSVAPAWRIGNVHTAYATAKYLAVMVMMLTAFPAYALARQLVGRLPALFVAAAALIGLLVPNTRTVTTTPGAVADDPEALQVE